MPGLSRNPELRARQLDGLAAHRFVLPSGDHNHPRRCTAMSKQAGRRCRNLAAKGMMVCRFHGGRAGRNRKDGSPPVTRENEATPARTQAKAKRMEKRVGSRLRRQGIAALAEMDHNRLDRETLATARGIYAQVLRVKGEPFGNETLAGAAFALCVQRATGEIRTVREFDAQCRRVLGLGLVPNAEERAAVEAQMAEARGGQGLGGPSGAGGW